MPITGGTESDTNSMEMHAMGRIWWISLGIDLMHVLNLLSEPRYSGSLNPSRRINPLIVGKNLLESPMVLLE